MGRTPDPRDDLSLGRHSFDLLSDCPAVLSRAHLCEGCFCDTRSDGGSEHEGVPSPSMGGRAPASRETSDLCSERVAGGPERKPSAASGVRRWGQRLQFNPMYLAGSTKQLSRQKSPPGQNTNREATCRSKHRPGTPRPPPPGQLQVCTLRKVAGGGQKTTLNPSATSRKAA